MSNIDLIRQEIERRIAGSDDAYARALKGILSFIDLLPEEYEDAVEGEVVQDLHGKLHVKTNAVSDILYQFGDKVKVIILPKK